MKTKTIYMLSSNHGGKMNIVADSLMIAKEKYITTIKKNWGIEVERTSINVIDMIIAHE